MKFGESTFDILYLLFAIISGLRLRKHNQPLLKQMGSATLILGCGDSFHLVPRVLNYFVDADFTVALGVGKFVTSITMTIFYVVLYHIWITYYQKTESKVFKNALYAFAIIRILLCLFPQNGWLTNQSDMTWGMIRNVPFVVVGGMVCYLYWKNRNQEKTFQRMWLLIVFSFGFYIPVAVGAGDLPILGMLMLPKTICYIWMIWLFLKVSKQETQN